MDPVTAGFLGFVAGAAAACLVFLRIDSAMRERSTLCCGASTAPCDDFHSDANGAPGYCGRCHHHYSCHDTEYDRL